MSTSTPTDPPKTKRLKNAKAKGSRNERRTIKHFEVLGYSCMKAGASLGVFDVIGLGPRDNVAVQVKTNRWPGSAEMQRIKDFVTNSSNRKLVVRWDDRKKVPLVREIT
jgi:hypothetical protein